MKFFLAMILSGLSVSPAWADLDPQPLKVKPSSVFTKESTALVFTLIPERQNGTLPESIQLIRLGDDGEENLNVIPILDTGLPGDRKGGDGIYTAKINMSSKKARTYRYQAQALYPGRSEPVSLGEVSVDVLGRPSFMEVLGKIYSKLTR